MSIQKLRPEKGSTPSRLWFMSKGYTPIDQSLVFGRVFYIHVQDMDVSILNHRGQKACIRILPNENASKNGRNTNFYYYLQFTVDGRTKNVPISLLVMATFNHQVPDRSKKEVIDHIDGNTLNNNPRNLRIVTRAINDRDGGFMRKLRNNGYNVADFPGIILEGYERMAEWKETHTKWQYRCLQKQDLLRVFVGPSFIISDPAIIDDLEPLKYADMYEH